MRGREQQRLGSQKWPRCFAFVLSYPVNNAIRRLLFPPFYRRANQESGNLRGSGRCQGAHQFKPVSDLSALCVILFPKVESGLWGKE